MKVSFALFIDLFYIVYNNMKGKLLSRLFLMSTPV